MANETDIAFWDRLSLQYDRKLPWLGTSYVPMVGLVASFVRGSKRVLELAAGTGLVTPFIAREAVLVISTDYSPGMIATLKNRIEDSHLTNVLCEQADIYSLKYEPGSFDAVVAVNLLHLLPDIPGALASAATVLRPGGVLITPTFCFSESWKSRLVLPLVRLSGVPVKHSLTLKSLCAAIESAGFDIEKSEVVAGRVPLSFVAGRKRA